MHIPGSTPGRGRYAAATAAAVILTTVFTGPGPAPRLGPADGTAPSGPVAPLEWSPCPESAGFECATAKVPLDHREPAGRTIELAVVKRKATGPGARIGTVFFNPGGPGGAGTEALPVWYDLFPEQVRQRFDVVSWDPRGVGASTAVRCFGTPEEAVDWQQRIPSGFPVGEQEQRTWIAAYADLGRRCEQRDPQLLRHVSTTDTARDLDRLRQAVGDPQLNYLGVSYGSLLGAVYANLFPDKVRAMVLDGNIDPVGWVNSGAKSEPRLSTFLRDEVDLGSAATLKQFLSLCGRATADRCAFSAGGPEATRTKFEQLMRRLEQRAQGPWTYARTVTTLLSNLYAVDPQWSAMAATLQDLWRWRAPEESPSPDGPLAYPGYEQIEAVRCAESPNPRDPLRYPALEEFSRARAGDLGRAVAWASEPCATWPVTAADSYTGPWNRPTAHPVLVVNTRYDPATPYRGALAMTRRLADARLLTVDGYGHSSLVNPSLCVDAYESRYFVDGVLPPVGATCRQDVVPFAKPRPNGGIDSGGGGTAGQARTAGSRGGK